MGLTLPYSTLVWVIITGFILLKFRLKISGLISKLPLPTFFLYLISGMFFSTIEENINCPPEGCSLFPLTLIAFFIYLLLHYLILKVFKIKKFYSALLIFGFFGWIVEFLFGADVGILWSNPLVTIIMTPWVIITYDIIVIIPTTIYLIRKNY